MTVYDGSPADALASRIGALGGRQVRLLLGPDVDPAAALAGQALITTSPSISSRFPTTEPRLRSALAEVEAAGRVPVISEVDLFLRLCPALTVGVTGTKGKTTTSSLTAAVLAAGTNPTVLGGNIGTPLVELLPELTARPPRRPRAVRAAAADALARHGRRRLHPRHQRPPRPPRQRRGIPRGQAATGRAAAGRWAAGRQRRGSGQQRLRRADARRRDPLPAHPPRPGEVGVVDDWVVAPASSD